MSPDPDRIFVNGNFITMDSANPTAEAVAIIDGRFVLVGTNDDVQALAGPDTERIDLAGQTVIPGLFDSHLHLYLAGIEAARVPLIDCRSIAELQEAISCRARATPKGGWIIGAMGWHESLLRENRLPTRDELDAAAPDHPVFVPRGGHVGSGNSRALELAGISEATADPPGGVIVREAGSQRPTGVVLEAACYLLRKPLPPPEREEALLRDAMEKLNSYGIVATMDPGLNRHQMGLYEALRARGEVTVRTDLMFRAYGLADTLNGLAIRDFQDDQFLRYVGIKFMLDGGVEGALHYDPYQIVPGEQNDPEYRGLSLLPPGGETEFVAALELIAQAGMQVQTHGVGDHCIDIIVDSYLAVARTFPINGLRWTVMHMHNAPAGIFARLRDTGIHVMVQDQSVLLGANKVKWWGRKRAEWSTPIRRMLDEGLLVGAGTDAPILPISPFICMWWMVTRKTLQGDCLGPDQAITISEALELYTVNNAKIMGVASERGAIIQGQLADMAVLDRNLLAIPEDEIRDTTVVMTVLGGRVVYRAALG
ncbi:amidohydrolase [Rhodobacter sp. 24-YEA-8]|uniref:amidohydrolase n=1 Tax=Rhodobacter sp. 24-YEA-8 TaxID=1884310 RepID=UPI00089C01FB|nr:amidohydrolase [Rhodobacter sp. 24-YEA-8]SED47762.1 hypothetical protein SAMN05519105_4082 [Rhodobacter sp. 24-YEA-8]